MRAQKLDILRGTAILGMIFYHTYYLSKHIFLVDFFHLPDIFWYVIGRVVAILFIGVAGVSFYISSEKKSLLRILQSSLRRFFILAIVAISITVTTYLFTYEQRILFGVIHFFALISLLSFLVLPFGRVNLLFGAIIIALGFIIDWVPDSDYFIVLGFYPYGFFSADYYPLIPWLGYYLIGYGGACWLKRAGKMSLLLEGKISGGGPMAFIGRNALIIYVVHIPILYIILFFYLTFL